MKRTTAWWAVTTGLGLALALVLVTTPDEARAGTVQVTSHVLSSDRGQWSGEHRRVSPGPYWRQGPEHRDRWEHRGRDDRWGHRGRDDRWGHQPRHGYWSHDHYYYPYGPYGHPYGRWGAAVWVPGYWAWNGWGWVWVPGYWR